MTLTPNSMMPFSLGEPPPAPVAEPSLHVRELWPLLPHCEHVRDIDLFGAMRASLALSPYKERKRESEIYI